MKGSCGWLPYRTKTQVKVSDRIKWGEQERKREREKESGREEVQTDGSVRQARPDMHHRLWELGDWGTG